MANSSSQQGQLKRAGVQRLKTGGPGSGPHKGFGSKSYAQKEKVQTFLDKQHIGTGGGAKHGPDEVSKLLMKKFGMSRSKANRAADRYMNEPRMMGPNPKESRKFKASKIRESIAHSFSEEGADEQTKKGKNRVYLCTIIEEGLGNSKDKNWYSAEALKSGTKVFDGAKAYADHPDAITEKTLPERSMKDLVGWYSDCFVDKNPTTGKVRLRGKIHFFPSAKWLTDMIDTILTDKSAKNMFGISINAVGRTRSAQMGGEKVNFVEEFQRVDSADVVTEPAARGGFDQMLESRRFGASGHSRKVSNSMRTSRRTREAAVLSPEKAKDVADSLVSAYNSDNPDEMKQAMFDAAKQLHAVSSISGKGPGQVNEEQYSNINPSGGSNEMKAKTKVKASTGKRSIRKGKRLMAADGSGPDNENVDEPDPNDIENELEESDVEDEEGDSDLGMQDDFGGGGKYRTKEAIEGFEDEDEGFEDEDEDGGMAAGGGGNPMPGAGVGAPAGGGAPGSSRTVASAEADDEDMDDDDDDMDDMDEAFEDEGLEDEGMEGMEDEDEGMEDEDEGSMMRPGTVAEARTMRRRRPMRASGNRGRRQFRSRGREAGRSSGSGQGRTVSKASYAGGLGHSGNTALPKGADPTKGYDPGGSTDEKWGKKDDSTSAVGKSYKLKTSKFRRNKAARRVAQEANRRIEILEDTVKRLRESNRGLGRKLDRYVGIVRFTESQKRAHRLLNLAVDRGILPEEMVTESKVLRESLYGLSEHDQVREIKKTALLLESAQEGVVSRLTESVEGSGARGSVASFIRTAGAEDSELASGFANAGIPMKEDE